MLPEKKAGSLQIGDEFIIPGRDNNPTFLVKGIVATDQPNGTHIIGIASDGTKVSVAQNTKVLEVKILD